MLQIPHAGPNARNANAHCQPSTLTTAGTAWIVTMVSRNPSEVCNIKAVPTESWGATSVTSALNCAESATTKKPQIQVRMTRKLKGA